MIGIPTRRGRSAVERYVRLRPLPLLWLLLAPATVSAGPVDFGAALEFVKASTFDGVDGGVGVQAGYEFAHTRHWNYGAQLAYFDGWTGRGDIQYENDLAFRSLAAYLTARPAHWPLSLRAGVVNADYKSLVRDRRTTGWAIGLSLSVGDEDWRIHLLDYEHYQFGADRFNAVGLSVGLLY